MNTPLLAGLFGAWAAVQLALAAFFVQAYAARRKEPEYLLFALMCVALAVTDCGLTVSAATHGTDHWALAMLLTHVGGIVATFLNLHFALQLVAKSLVSRIVRVAYLLCAALLALLFTGAWWGPGAGYIVHAVQLGMEVQFAAGRPTALATCAYVTLLGLDLATIVIMTRAYLLGRRDIRGALFGLGVTVACGANDIAMLALQLSTPPLLPYGFLIYGFGVADTLLVRYRRAAEELEMTATELRQATDELTSSYLELSVVQEELFKKRQLASVGELAASIAHEVRNPLAIIVNAAANLKRPSLGPDDRNTLFVIIEEEITRLNNIVTELLRYARPMNVRREEVALSDIVKAIGETLPEPYALSVKIASDPDVETAWADPTLLRLALKNLFDNARQAMPLGGTITVTASKDRIGGVAGVRLEVADTGQGMDPRTLARAMDPFFTTRPRGTGLGLPITGRIAEAHGGHIDVDSRAGGGTTVALFIPGKRSEGRLSDARIAEGLHA